MSFSKVSVFIAIFASLIISIVFSYNSFTGYLVSDEVNNSANLVSFLFLVIGLVLTWVYISKYRYK